MTEPTDKEQYLNIADQCSATATSELAASILVDGGNGTLRQLLNDAADAIRAGWAAPPTQAQAGAELAEADRRAGAAERELASCREDVARFTRLRDQMKEQWGVDRNVSFDVVWAEALKLKKQAGAVPLPKSYQGSTLTSNSHDAGCRVSFSFSSVAEAEAWHESIIDRHHGIRGGQHGAE